jgi:hypothetical protein
MTHGSQENNDKISPLIKEKNSPNIANKVS